MNALTIALAAGVLAGVLAPLAIVPAGQYGDLSTSLTWQVAAPLLLAGACFAGLVALVRHRPLAPWAFAIGLGLALLARLVLVATPPVLSTDLYRYVWDGRVQAAGINPYRYLPADSALAFLRDPATGPTAIFININRAETAPTIYPPAAQLLFAAIGATASSIWTIKAAMLALDLLAGVLAWRLLVAAGRPAQWVLVWALNPLVIREFAGAGHVDAAALAASAAALLLAAKRKPAWAGAALGVAILCKLLPAALAPAIWRPRGWRAPLACVAVIVAGYAVYASAGSRVLGYLGGYATEEGLGGSGFLLLRLLALFGKLPSWANAAYALAALLLLRYLALAIIRHRAPPDPAVIARQALLLSVALLVVVTPHYPWYLTMAALPAVVAPGWGALWPSVVGPLLYGDFGLSDPWWPAIVYLPTMAWLAAALRRGTEDA